MGRRILAIDQGTTSTKALLIDEEGRVLSRGASVVSIEYPRSGWVQQDAEELWRSVLEAAEQCLIQVGGAPPDALGVTNQRESAMFWDRRTGASLGPVVSWQCRRGAKLCEALRAEGLGARVASKTGLLLDPMFSASKARWLLDSIPNGAARAEAGEICFGTIDSWLVWKLTGGAAHVTDASNASRTLLLNLKTGDWDSELLALFGIPKACLPEIVNSSGVIGETAAQSLVRGIPLTGLAGDSHAAMFGHGAFDNQIVKATYGTGTSLMMLTPGERSESKSGALSRTIAWRLGSITTFALEGNILSSGATLDWCKRLICETVEAAESAEGVYLVPAFVGLGAPYWDDAARGLICGMTFDTGPRQIARAAIESVAHQVADVASAMEGEGGAIEALCADGGASRSDALMQFQADLIGRPVLRNRCADLSALGAAWLAGLGAGVWRSLDDLRALARDVDRFEPRMSRKDQRAARDGWRDAVARARLKFDRAGA